MLARHLTGNCHPGRVVRCRRRADKDPTFERSCTSGNSWSLALPLLSVCQWPRGGLDCRREALGCRGRVCEDRATTIPASRPWIPSPLPSTNVIFDVPCWTSSPTNKPSHTFQRPIFDFVLYEQCEDWQTRTRLARSPPRPCLPASGQRFRVL